MESILFVINALIPCPLRLRMSRFGFVAASSPETRRNFPCARTRKQDDGNYEMRELALHFFLSEQTEPSQQNLLFFVLAMEMKRRISRMPLTSRAEREPNALRASDIGRSKRILSCSRPTSPSSDTYINRWLDFGQIAPFLCHAQRLTTRQSGLI